MINPQSYESHLGTLQQMNEENLKQIEPLDEFRSPRLVAAACLV